MQFAELEWLATGIALGLLMGVILTLLVAWLFAGARADERPERTAGGLEEEGAVLSRLHPDGGRHSRRVRT